MIIDPNSIPASLAYRLLTRAVIPRPIGFISSISAGGVANLAPFSFFNAVCGEPPMIMFCTSNRRPPKDTLANVTATREFVANIVSEEIAEQMNLTSGDYPPDVSEFDVAGLTPVPSDLVRPPRVAQVAAPDHWNAACLTSSKLATKPVGQRRGDQRSGSFSRAR